MAIWIRILSERPIRKPEGTTHGSAGRRVFGDAGSRIALCAARRQRAMGGPLQGRQGGQVWSRGRRFLLADDRSARKIDPAFDWRLLRDPGRLDLHAWRRPAFTRTKLLRYRTKARRRCRQHWRWRHQRHRRDRMVCLRRTRRAAVDRAIAARAAHPRRRLSHRHLKATLELLAKETE